MATLIDIKFSKLEMTLSAVNDEEARRMAEIFKDEFRRLMERTAATARYNYNVRLDGSVINKSAGNW
jgi:hypothetical protein